MNAVIYARYSSDSQREESIEGQLRECREYAEFYSAELSEKIHRRQKENALRGHNNTRTAVTACRNRVRHRKYPESNRAGHFYTVYQTTA